MRAFSRTMSIKTTKTNSGTATPSSAPPLAGQLVIPDVVPMSPVATMQTEEEAQIDGGPRVAFGEGVKKG